MYTIGVDFGTESGRAVLVDTRDGSELATAVHTYAHGVIDEHLPGSDHPLPPDWALQDPADYLAVLQQAAPVVLEKSGIDPAEVVGIGIDFTCCTMLPTTRDGTPLSFLDQWRENPHACWGKACSVSLYVSLGQFAHTVMFATHGNAHALMKNR